MFYSSLIAVILLIVFISHQSYKPGMALRSLFVLMCHKKLHTHSLRVWHKHHIIMCLVPPKFVKVVDMSNAVKVCSLSIHTVINRHNIHGVPNK